MNSPRPLTATDSSEAVLYGTQAQVRRAFKEWQARCARKATKRITRNRKK